MDLFDLSSALFGRKGMDSDSVEYEETTRTYVGTATSDSADGSVYVELSEDVTMPDEYEGEHGMGVEMPTVPGVSEGDEVLVTVFGSGAMKSPVVTGNAGEGDRQNAAIAAAHAVADAAQAVANAVNQHFFADTNGIHVTEATQEDWNTDHSGANVLINSIGQLFRDGLNNLLTLTTENGARALTIWDGLGNAAGNVVARFGSTIRLGSDEYPMLDISDGTIYFYPTADDVQSLYFGPTTRIQRLLNGSLKLQSDNGAVSLYGQTIGVAPANGTNTFSTAPGTVLWSGSYYMTSSHTANLAYNISTCHSGIVLHFQPYTSGTAQNYFHQYCFVPKTTSFGAVHNFTLCNSGFVKVGMKALRIYDNRIVGDDSNDDTGTASGITFDNKYWVLTQVIAV